jgi:DNA-binding phage protein
MNKDTTRNLSRILEDMSDHDAAEQFIKEYSSGPIEHFYQYFNSYVAASNKNVTDVIRRSGISRNYVYNILNGNKSNPGRDKVLALCIGAGMNFSQTQRGLEISGLAPLYPKNERDVRISIAINQGIDDVAEINRILDSFHLTLLNI